MLYMYCSRAATTVIQLFAASVVNKLIDHSMDQQYGELYFAHTFSQTITSIVHKLTPCIACDLGSEIILCNSERKYNTSESGAIYLSLLQNNDELIKFKKPKKFNVLIKQFQSPKN